MKIHINKEQIDIFEGARVRDAVYSYLHQIGHTTAEINNMVFRDRTGHVIAEDAPLTDGAEINISSRSSHNKTFILTN